MPRNPSPARRTPSLTLLAPLLAAALCLGCASGARRERSQAELRELVTSKEVEADQTIDLAIDKIIARLEQAGAGGATIDMLAMSGGGEYGAFGAGFLVGWGDVHDSQWRRPEFDVVSGVSTGALLAPFALLGTDDAYLQAERLYRNPKPDWVKPRGPLYFLPSNPSFLNADGLDRDIRATINADLIRRIAAESRLGKVLAISATDLDLGHKHIWDLGEQAELATDDAGVDTVQRILLASAAIPGVFPPVRVGESIYVDGGVTANVLVRLDVHDPNSLLPRWRAVHPDLPLPKVRYWVIVNNQLLQPPKTVQLKWRSVLGPSVSTAIRSATLAEIRWLAAEADYVNALYGTDIEVWVTAIPNDWRPLVEGNFQPENMQDLADRGRIAGADPSSWQLWSVPVHPPSPRAAR